MKLDEYAPTKIPHVRLIANSLMSPELKIASGTIAKSVVKLVINVLVRDWFTEFVIISPTSPSLFFITFSLTLSKITIVLFKEYPMIVRIAAIVVDEISRRQIKIKESIANTS